MLSELPLLGFSSASWLSKVLDFRTPEGTGSMTTPLNARLAPRRLSRSSLLEVLDDDSAVLADLKKKTSKTLGPVYVAVI